MTHVLSKSHSSSKQTPPEQSDVLNTHRQGPVAISRLVWDEHCTAPTCKVALHCVGIQGGCAAGGTPEGLLVRLYHGLEKAGDPRQDINAAQVHKGDPQVRSVQHLRVVQRNHRTTNQQPVYG